MAIQKNREQKNDYFAVAIYEDMLCESLGINKPLKRIEDRMKIIEQLRGVDFVFSITSLEQKIVQERAKNALEEHIKFKDNKKGIKEEEKEYDIAYAPGTYDLFHAGHLENLMEAHKKSKKLIVGVKSDELVQKHKERLPMIPAEERMEILRHFRFVHDVYQYYTRDPHIAATWIEGKYGKKVDAIFLGSDLRKDFEDIEDINIVFTDRDEEKMKDRSTTGYIKTLRLRQLSQGESEKYTGNIKMQKKETENKKLGEEIVD